MVVIIECYINFHTIWFMYNMKIPYMEARHLLYKTIIFII